MLIDKTYFQGPLYLAQLTQADNVANLNWFIKLNEPKILKSVLGYALYKAMLAGLAEVVVLQKWTDLLYGAEYTRPNGRPDKWPGIITYTDGVTIGNYIPSDRFYIVDGPGATDPASGQNQLRDVFLKNNGASYRVVERGTGTLKPTTEYTLVDVPGGFNKAVNFTPGGVYTVEFTKAIPLPAPAVVAVSDAVQSFLANFIFYEYMENEAVAITGAGKKAIAAINAQVNTDAVKEVTAWNEGVNMVRMLKEFLQVNRVNYPEYVDTEWYEGGYRGSLYGIYYGGERNKYFKFKSTIG